MKVTLLKRCSVSRPQKHCKKILVSFILLFCMAAAFSFFSLKKADALTFKTATIGDVTWGYLIDNGIKNGPASRVQIYGQDIAQSLVIPASFTDEYGTHDVVSIGQGTVSNEDSFLQKCTISNIIDIDASACTKLKKVNDFSLYERAYVRSFILPKNVEYYGAYVLSGCVGTTVTLPNPNVTFGGTYDGDATFRVPVPSSAVDFVGKTYGDKKILPDGTTPFRIDLSYEGADEEKKVRRDYVYLCDSYNKEDNVLGAVASLTELPEKTTYDFTGFYRSTDAAGKGEGEKYIDERGKLVSSVTFDGDMTLYAGFVPKKYKISYGNLDGSETSTDTFYGSYTYGTGCRLPADIKKEGYSFAGWYTTEDFQEDTRILEIPASASGVYKLYARWIPVHYRVVLDKNTEDENVTGTFEDIDAVYDTAFTLPDKTYERPGYVFTGWKVQGKDTVFGKGQTVNGNLASGSGVTVRLLAQWEAGTGTEYTVNCVYEGLTEDGNVTESHVYTGTTDTVVTPDPALWKRAGFVTPVKQSLTIKGTADAVLTYTYKRQEYHVTLNTADGINALSLTDGSVTRTQAGSYAYLYGQKISFSCTVSPGYTFEKWTVTAGSVSSELNNGVPAGCITVGTSDVVLTPSVSANADTKYTVRCVYKGLPGTEDEVTEHTFTGITGSLVFPGPSRWKKEGFSTPEVKSLAVAGDGKAVLTYTYNRMQYAVSVEKGTGVSNVQGEGTYYFGQKVTLSFDTQDGYAPDGFTYESASVTGAVQTDNSLVFTLGAEDAVVSAKALPRTYPLEYVLNGGTVKGDCPEEYTHGKETTLPANVTKAGFRFLGWYLDEKFTGDPVKTIGKTETGYITLYARYGTGNYTISYDTDGGTIQSGSVTEYKFNNPVTLPSDVTKKGYTFLGWWDGEKMVKEISASDYGDKEFLALWQDNASTRVNIPDGDGYEFDTDGTDVAKAAYPENSDTGYYYTKLSTVEKTIYGALFNYYRFIPEKKELGNTDSVLVSADSRYAKENAYNAAAAMILDHPEIFWLRYLVFAGCNENDGTWYGRFTPVWAYDETMAKADAISYHGYFVTGLSDIGIKTADTAYDKVRKIHDYIVKYYSYNNTGYTLNEKTANDTRSVGRMLSSKTGCCEGYAGLFKVYCDYYGIKCIEVVSDSHMWNMVTLDGKTWYGVDVTSDDSWANRAFFLKGTSVFSESNDKIFKITNEFYTTSAYGKFAAPAVSKTDYGTSKPSAASKTDTALPRKNTKHTVSGITYAITKTGRTGGTVSVAGLRKKTVVSVTIPSTVKISGCTFKVTAVNANALKGCKKLKKVTVGANVTKIGNKAFAGNKKLSTVIIRGKKLATIGTKAFYGCRSLKKLVLKTTVLKKVGKDAIKGIHKKAIIDVPKQSVRKYRKLFGKKGYVKGMKIK